MVLLSLAWSVAAQRVEDGASWDRETALANSQEAIGRTLEDHVFVRGDGSEASLADFAGKPLLISLIFTSCHHVCPVTTQRLGDAVRAARQVLGDDSFSVLTIGFDTANDTPEAMATFARQQSIDMSDWEFLSASPETIADLTGQLGFLYYPSPRGFDHITQISVIDRDGVVYRQVYGMEFELPWLVEPLKELVFNRPASAGHFMSGLVDRVRLFCTVYDPSTGRYKFDYSLFIQIAIGLAAIIAVAFFLISGSRRAKRG
jgi:protein SCO1/2